LRAAFLYLRYFGRVKNKIIIAVYAIQTAFYLGKEPSIPLLISFLLLEYVVMAVIYSVMYSNRTRDYKHFFMNLIAVLFFCGLFLAIGFTLWAKVQGINNNQISDYTWGDAYGGNGLVLLVGLVCIVVAFIFEVKEIKKAHREDFVFTEFFFQGLALVLVPSLGLGAADMTNNSFIILTWMILTRISFEIFSMQRHKKARIGVKA